MAEHGETDETLGQALAGLNVQLGRQARMLHLLKLQLASLAPEGLDLAASTLLVHLVRCGPGRQSDLAGAAVLDRSTVSRYVAQLVREGLVERRPDPEDGRAVHLVATPAGVALQERIAAHRSALLHQALAGWNPRDIALLTQLLLRFNDDLEAFHPPPSRAAPFRTGAQGQSSSQTPVLSPVPTHSQEL